MKASICTRATLAIKPGFFVRARLSAPTPASQLERLRQADAYLLAATIARALVESPLSCAMDVHGLDGVVTIEAGDTTVALALMRSALAAVGIDLATVESRTIKRGAASSEGG